MKNVILLTLLLLFPITNAQSQTITNEELRIQIAVLETRINQLRSEINELKNVPQQLATLNQQIKQVLDASQQKNQDLRAWLITPISIIITSIITYNLTKGRNNNDTK